eukprot:TRINITY_DN24291_c0_g1_i1.p1 TRINITY_DN24291_c0_g1~~TRINITY_DN24291_c0_g1_i1.p1  ORF type:complete len:411 (-),score=32.81 TRINITY_DN24291_c0_g1_i1:32-1264(-)
MAIPDYKVALLCCSAALGMAVSHMQIPFAAQLREDVGCDSFCNGQMNSAKSALGLIGAVLVGRLSDLLGRKTGLWIALCGQIGETMLWGSASSVSHLWYSVIIGSILKQQFEVSKAMITDWTEHASVEERSAKHGLLGMSLGIGVFGTAGSALLTSTFDVARVGLVLSLLTGLIILFLPSADRHGHLKATESNDSYLFACFNLPCLRTPASMLLISIRACMGLGFYIYITIFQDSMRRRFDFAPKDFSKLMGFIGIVYAFSQGALSKKALTLFGRDSAWVLVICCLLLSLGRVIATLTLDIVWVYVGSLMVVVGLGVMNSAIAAGASSIASSDEAGGLFGVLAAAEKVGGIVGPLLGGFLWRQGGDTAVLGGLLVAYAIVLLLVFSGWRPLIVDAVPTTEGQDATKAKQS